MADPAQTPKVDVTSAPTSGGIESKPQIGSLHVADLDKSVSESVLYHFFRTRGFTIGSIRVCKDSATDISLGYAYANFHDRAEAQRAMDELNYTPIIPNGAPCRISWVERDPSKRKSGVGNLFIKNLDKDIDNEALYGAFGEYGKIISCKVAVDENNVSKGYGFVQFDREEDSEAAIAALNGKCFNGKPVYVGPFIPKAKRPSQESNFTNVYLKEIHPDITSEQFDVLVAKITEDIGKITSPKLMVEIVEKDGKRVEKSRRFGFVNFENHDVAVKALERFNDDAKVKEIAPEFVAEGKQLYANRAIPKSQRKVNGAQQQKQNLYIKNLHESIDDEKLRSIFAEFGNIGSAVVMRNPEGISKGFGFVCFDSPESAANAIRQLHQTKKVEGKPLYVAFAQSKAYRKLHLTQLYQNRSVMPLPPQMMAYPPNPYSYQMRMGQPPRGFRGGYRGRPGYVPNGPVPTQAPVHFNQGQFENASPPIAEGQIHGAADHLFKKLQEQYKGTNEVDIKRVVGHVLADTQAMSKEQALAYITEFIESPEKRDSLIAKLNSKKE